MRLYRLACNPQPYDITHRLRMADGRIKYVHERCESEFDAEDKPLRSMGTVQDITERKLATKHLPSPTVCFRPLLTRPCANFLEG